MAYVHHAQDIDLRLWACCNVAQEYYIDVSGTQYSQAL
jgi:hypothetical protein